MSKSSEEIKSIVSQMTLDEKVRCCALYQDRFGNLPRFGIAYRSCDNPSGGWCDYFRLPREHRDMECGNLKKIRCESTLTCLFLENCILTESI